MYLAYTIILKQGIRLIEYPDSKNQDAFYSQTMQKDGSSPLANDV